MGGNGFSEDFPMARLFRHSPLNSIWEGSGNVIALDILRGIKAMPILLQEIKLCMGADSCVDAYIKDLEAALYAMAKDPEPHAPHNQRAARNIADRLAIAMQCSFLLRYGDPLIAKGYIASRLAATSTAQGVNYGSHVFDASLCQHIIDRNMPRFTPMA